MKPKPSLLFALFLVVALLISCAKILGRKDYPEIPEEYKVVEIPIIENINAN